MCTLLIADKHCPALISSQSLAVFSSFRYLNLCVLFDAVHV